MKPTGLVPCIWFLFMMLATTLPAASLDRSELTLALRQGQGTKIATVTLTNDWDEVFTITGIATNCACIGHDASASVLKPGETSEIYLIFDVGIDTKPYTKKMTISGRGESGKTQSLPLKVKVKIAPVLNMSKKGLHWAKDGAPGEQTLSISFLPGNPFRILSIIPPKQGNLTVTSVIDPSGSSAVITVNLIDATKPTTTTLTVTTDHPKAPLAMISVLCTNEFPEVDEFGQRVP